MCVSETSTASFRAGATYITKGATTQLAKYQGAHVIVMASGRPEAWQCELGADEVINYTQPPAEGVGHDADFVLDILLPLAFFCYRVGALFSVFLGAAA
jgi:NADPH:quinone reductase-like Zn-dependent oxidoreductase